MSTNHDKYLVLRGKNKDIYFIQKRVSKKVSKIIGKDFIKKSLETSDIKVARDKRDEILAELVSIEAMSTNNSYVENDNLEDKIMSNESISGVSNENAKNITKNSEKDGFLEEYLDMDYIKSLRFPTKDSLIESFDNNLLILLVIGVMIVFFLLN
jgi:ATP-dependent phosphoenolpyruvate carboxykinase|tara:strand:+ start:815 stop:1279 length:465 start_codon:yes stop_codon:yes gene_type:complete